ncbi:unnamed protein product [Vitrella brassicaformis CCMP3155]|uniref:Protein kinase domain-containing protein n=1 Tax=Vitrella brassicaformis (strain CCMP3155) TaxID=1169540 RepID=A0A0G4H056_VITBC|nr:unnamed protein product [Vitrella brassicaformis CCMP3155]|mmetsp:Transcript_22056/g.54146  ORF Transcript_22056/g.54146 Transcript_22056/m.54146 type:complete len:96 (+) Transcript_22056:10-297(+)|eukprot:CEM36930.1 unnamed protein product [Vitrella brassicaformis CCMP3155]
MAAPVTSSKAQDPTEIYTTYDVVGKSANSRVIRAKQKGSNEVRAIKITKCDRTSHQNIEKEIEMMKACRTCPDIVHLYGTHEDSEGRSWMVMGVL